MSKVISKEIKEKINKFIRKYYVSKDPTIKSIKEKMNNFKEKENNLNNIGEEDR